MSVSAAREHTAWRSPHLHSSEHCRRRIIAICHRSRVHGIHLTFVGVGKGEGDDRDFERERKMTAMKIPKTDDDHDEEDCDYDESDSGTDDADAPIVDQQQEQAQCHGQQPGSTDSETVTADSNNSDCSRWRASDSSSRSEAANVDLLGRRTVTD